VQADEVALAAAVEAARELGYLGMVEDEESDAFRTGVLFMLGLEIGQRLEDLVRVSGYPEQWVAERRLRWTYQGIWGGRAEDRRERWSPDEALMEEFFDGADGRTFLTFSQCVHVGLGTGVIRRGRGWWWHPDGELWDARLRMQAAQDTAGRPPRDRHQISHDQERFGKLLNDLFSRWRPHLPAISVPPIVAPYFSLDRHRWMPFAYAWDAERMQLLHQEDSIGYDTYREAVEASSWLVDRLERDGIILRIAERDKQLRLNALERRKLHSQFGPGERQDTMSVEQLTALYTELMQREPKRYLGLMQWITDQQSRDTGDFQERPGRQFGERLP
jgi:hypothetical protein